MFGISLVLKLRISEKSTWFAQEWVVFFPLLVIMFYVCSRMWSLMLIIPANPEIKDTQTPPHSLYVNYVKSGIVINYSLFEL